MTSRIQRYIQICELIKTEPETWTCGKLGVRFGVSKQQIHRDIQQLRDAGFEIQSSLKGYQILSEKKASPDGG